MFALQVWARIVHLIHGSALYTAKYGTFKRLKEVYDKINLTNIEKNKS